MMAHQSQRLVPGDCGIPVQMALPCAELKGLETGASFPVSPCVCDFAFQLSVLVAQLHSQPCSAAVAPVCKAASMPGHEMQVNCACYSPVPACAGFR